MPDRHIDISTKAQALSLKLYGATNAEIFEATGIPQSTVSRILSKAKIRGFNPEESKLIKDEYLVDAERSGRPKKVDKSMKAVISRVKTDRYGREKTCQMIANELGNLSAMTVWRILRSAGMRKTKSTRKPGLTPAMKAARLAWAKKHENWELEDWKKVIFSDETSVVLGHRRGSYRVWRTPGINLTSVLIYYSVLIIK
jgi:transposase